MSKKKLKDTAKAVKEKKPIWEDPLIIWDGPLIAETVILSILAAAFIGAGFFLYFYDLSFLADSTKSVNEFFSSPADVDSTIKPFCAPLIISGLSYLLFFSYRVMELDGSKWFHALLNLVYLGLVAVILYFNWYNCEAWFDYPSESYVAGQVIRYILWANSVCCGVFFLLYYSILVHVRDWSKPWDIVMTLFMMTFLPVILIIGFVVVSIGGVISAIMLPGKAIQKSVDSDLASRSSDYRGQAYTVRHESGNEETVYSTNGSDFYGSDGRYIGHKD